MIGLCVVTMNCVFGNVLDNSNGAFEISLNETTSYEWNDGASGLQFDNLPAGVYTMSGTYNDICPFELNVILENENGADVSVSTLSHQTCQGSLQ